MPPPAAGFASRLFLGPALRTQPDWRLVALVRDGYETAFEEIVRRYGKPLSRYAASIVGGRSEDVLQDAFAKALPALRHNDVEIELRPWLFRIVRNTALNDLRDSPPSAEILAEALAGAGNPAEELERREELAELIKRLQALPAPQRAAIVMRELEGLGHEEIAAALGLTGGGARQAIYRARQALRDGAGMLIPLPLLQALLAGGGSGVAETAASAGVSVAGIGGATGAGVALKATAATVLVAGAVGAGVAVKGNQQSGEAEAAPARVSQSDTSQTATPATATTQDTSFSQGGDDSDGPGKPEPSDDHGGHGDGVRGEVEPVDDHHRHGGGEREAGDDHGGSSGRHGGSSGNGGGDGRSGPSGYSGSSGSSNSGSGHGDDSGSGHGSGHDSSGSGGSDLGHDGSGSGGSASGGDSGSSGSSLEGGSGSGDALASAPSGEPLPDDGSSGGSGSDSSSGSGSGSYSGEGASGSSVGL